MKAEARGRSVGRAFPLACLLVVCVALPARAEHHSYEGRTFDRSPAEGLPGSVIQVWGTGCSENGKPYQQAYVRLGNGTYASDLKYYAIRSDGTWSGDFAVPREAPSGDYRLGADCIADDMVFPVGYQDFKVLDPSPPPTTTTTTTPTTSPTRSPSTTSRPTTSKPASPASPSSIASPPSTAQAPSSPPSSEPIEMPSSVPTAVDTSPEEAADGWGATVPLAIAAALAVGAAGLGAVLLRRRTTLSE